MSTNKNRKESLPYMNVTSTSPYEQMELFDTLTGTVASPSETRRLRLECILAAITTGVRDSEHVVATAQKFWDFVQETD